MPARASAADAAPRAALYVTGWLKRGPSGVIGTNRACAVETVATLLAEHAAHAAHAADALRDVMAGRDGVLAQLAACGVEPFRWPDWQRVDAAERGAETGAVRVKVITVPRAREIAPPVAADALHPLAQR
jgi:ferredoxin/flavodoxin---NADP+ reductase